MTTNVVGREMSSPLGATICSFHNEGMVSIKPVDGTAIMSKCIRICVRDRCFCLADEVLS